MFSTRRTRQAGLVSAFAGALFVPYALTKGYLASLIVAAGWQFTGLSPEQTAWLFHVLEAVPLVGVAVGLLALGARLDVRNPLAVPGCATIVVGAGLTVLVHLGEHSLPPATVPALTGGADWLIWGYYLSWLVLYAGLAVFGVSLLLSSAPAGRLPWLFVFGPPCTVAVGVALAAADLFTVAGSFRMFMGFTGMLVGWRLWASSNASSLSSTDEPTTNYRTGDH